MARIDDMETALSLERFGRYVAWAGGDRERALDLYTLNTRVSEALYIALQTLEVSLRNRIHTVMAAKHGERWFQDADLIKAPLQRAQVAEAIRDLEAEGKDTTAGRVVAALSFSFWTAMFSPAYEDLWRSTLRFIAVREGKGLTRKDFSRPLTQIRLLRNRVAHHEPILHWDLHRHHRLLRELTLWLSPPAFAWSRALDRFEAVYPAEGALLARDAQD
ncbi:Abi family protein [uncultured Caulobacter sp.]|uniref:Abi family protein n=1 Tax=uncultured Caulobacter sp. TaxID=158749 RepID=UPI002617DACE|nr:Abi family protein [uncultured Caulobacter sp.]